MAIRPNRSKPTPTKIHNPFLRHAQPPPFTARGRGYFNRLPDFPAGPSNANASLVNKATGRHDLRKIYLFVDAVETGWKVAGETTQTQNARSFYPRNLTQDELAITGTVANQYEYDRLVEFILHHHHSQFTNAILQETTLDGDGGYPGVQFSLFKPANSQIDTFAPMRYLVAITDIQAGAERFQMVGKQFQLTCKVVYDYLQRQTHANIEIDKRINFEQVFGAATNPDPSAGWDALLHSITVGAQIATTAAEGAGLGTKAIAND